MTVYCQNFDKHDPNWREFKIFGAIQPQRCPLPIICEETRSGFYCPVCKEFVDISEQMYASWGPLEYRYGYPKSMIRKM